MNVTPINLLSQLDAFNALEVGDNILVRFGSRGTQAAYVWRRTPEGNLMVLKYREKSKSYTKPVRLHPDQLIRRIG